MTHLTSQPTAMTNVLPSASLEVAAATQPTDMPPADSRPAAAPARPLNDVRTQSRLLKIAGEGTPHEIPLCVISMTDVAQVNLELMGQEFSWVWRGHPTV